MRVEPDEQGWDRWKQRNPERTPLSVNYRPGMGRGNGRFRLRKRFKTGLELVKRPRRVRPKTEAQLLGEIEELKKLLEM